MANNLSAGGVIQLDNTMELDVEYEPDGESVEAVLTVCVRHRKHPNQFYIELDLQGIFRLDGINGAASKKETHIRCYDTLFPFASQIMTYLATNSGMQGFMLQKMEMEPETVNFGAKPNDKIIEFRDDSNE